MGLVCVLALVSGLGWGLGWGDLGVGVGVGVVYPLASVAYHLM